MAPIPTTEDYYAILEVAQSASAAEIKKAYHCLAVKLHPDKNRRHDATAAFQRLAKAYDVLRDDDERRKYDNIYDSIRREPGPRPTPAASHSMPEQVSEEVQITRIVVAVRERKVQWSEREVTMNSAVLELRKKIGRLEQEVKDLNTIAAAEAAGEAWRNSWMAWMLSPFTKQREKSDEEVQRRDRGRQERRIEKDLKERKMQRLETEAKEKETELSKARREFEAAELADAARIQDLRRTIFAREALARAERDRIERERAAAAAEAARRAQREESERARAAQALARAQREAERARMKRERAAAAEASRARHGCDHGGWWDKSHGRRPCPECDDVWPYLLVCPGCSMLACPKCQAILRPPRSRRGKPRVRREETRYDWDDF